MSYSNSARFEFRYHNNTQWHTSYFSAATAMADYLIKNRIKEEEGTEIWEIDEDGVPTLRCNYMSLATKNLYRTKFPNSSI